jgi:PleD family two-component response regulator
MTDQAGAIRTAETIRAEVRRLAIPHRRSGVAGLVTVSSGLVTVRCRHPIEASDLVAEGAPA